MATGFYYLAAAPPASAAMDVCGPGNYSSACVPDSSPSPQSPETVADPVPTSPASLRDAVPEAPVAPAAPIPIIEPLPEVPVVQSPTPLIVEPVVEEAPVVQSPPTSGEIPILPTPEIQVIPSVSPSPVSAPIQVSSPILPNYINPPVIRTTTIPEPGTVVALLLTGAGIICSARKRNKQVGQQR
jgi:hypothetical protein